ncbi:hypothetical protein [Mycolicibacterium bacteremicum]|uniref:hypothetical protein n=1 Tax=Mycolicibacterium bacteremicum TaxID=564198 RepID=UPI0026ECE5B8|nr:hypothetical protein [Mycolicibacterium bacteremicum]
MSPRGRLATLPEPNHSSPHGLQGDGVTVRCYVQGANIFRDFDFSTLPVASELQSELAVAFAGRCAPGQGLTRLDGFRSYSRAARLFASYLSTLPTPATKMAEISPEHIDGFVAHRRGSTSVHSDVRRLKSLLRFASVESPSLAAKLIEPSPAYVRKSEKRSYSRGDFTAIAQAARSDLRAAAQRIRTNRTLVRQFRAGELSDSDRRLELMSYVEANGDVPRYERKTPQSLAPPMYWVQRSGFGTVTDIVSWTHLNCVELAAGAILLTIMTGQNPSVVMDLAAAHHRTDGHIDGETATAVLDTYKPRRGRRAYMNLALSEIPDWISAPSNAGRLKLRDELHTPFGVYALLLDLSARSRDLSDSDRLLVGWHGSGGLGGQGRGMRVLRHREPFRVWSSRHNLLSEDEGDGGPVSLRVTLDRLRLTYLELHQKPVAHTDNTLVKDYLGRNRGNLKEYRNVVADALAEEVAKARSRNVIETISKDELSRVDPQTLAAKHGIEPLIFKRMVAGELDTVMNACIDNENSPYSAAGEPCRASFMMCLECPCARALPRHLPIQVLVYDSLENRRAAMTPLTWTRRFAQPHAQLADLLSAHHPSDVEDARQHASDAQRAIVERFMNRETDFR